MNRIDQKIDLRLNKLYLILTDCWLYTGRVNHLGNGYIQSQGHRHNIRNYQYERYYGEIPYGFKTRTNCGMNTCLNPEHLELVLVRRNQYNLIHGFDSTDGGI